MVTLPCIPSVPADHFSSPLALLFTGDAAGADNASQLQPAATSLAAPLRQLPAITHRHNPPATCHVATAHLHTPHQSTAVQVEAESGPLYAAPSASPKVGSVQSLPSILCCRWDHLSAVAGCAGTAGWGGSRRRVSTPCLPGQNKQVLGPYYIHLC